jgi:hypothetical protein
MAILVFYGSFDFDEFIFSQNFHWQWWYWWQFDYSCVLLIPSLVILKPVNKN